MESVQNETEVKQAVKLTRGEQKRALSSGKKGRRQVVHTTLDSPFDITWPEISSEDQDRIETLFKENLVSLRMPNERFSKAELQGIPRSERNLARKKRRLEALGESLLQQRQDQKRSLLLGLNAVTRHLETLSDPSNSILVVLCDRTAQPSLLTKFLIPLCQSRGVPLLPVKNLSALLQSCLGLPRCLALAVKSNSPAAPNLEHLKNALAAMAPQWPLPSHAIKVLPEDREAEEDSLPSATLPIPVDVSKFHLTKPQSGVAFVPQGKANPLHTIEPPVAFGADFIRFDAANRQESSPYRPLSVKRVHSHVDKPKKKKKLSKKQTALD